MLCTLSNMKFALVDNQRVEAEKGKLGLCPGCMQPVIAKCGNLKVNHWAHKANKSCDTWFEPETQWHRDWKNQFPREWQEIFLTDENTGEKHIADVKSPLGFVVEFQHSAIKKEEQVSRERFYKNMVWIIDGSRLKYDWPRFLKGFKNEFKRTILQGFFLTLFPEEVFPKNWVDNSVPVIFDFSQVTTDNPMDEQLKNTLWCLMPGRAKYDAVVCGIDRNQFIDQVRTKAQLFDKETPEGFVKSFERAMNS